MFPDLLHGYNFEPCILISITTSLETRYKKNSMVCFHINNIDFLLKLKLTGQL